MYYVVEVVFLHCITNPTTIRNKYLFSQNSRWGNEKSDLKYSGPTRLSFNLPPCFRYDERSSYQQPNGMFDILARNESVEIFMPQVYYNSYIFFHSRDEFSVVAIAKCHFLSPLQIHMEMRINITLRSFCTFVRPSININVKARNIFLPGKDYTCY